MNARKITIVETGDCPTCGARCVRFVLEGQVGTFHADPVCTPFLEHVAGKHCERVQMNQPKSELRSDPLAVN